MIRTVLLSVLLSIVLIAFTRAGFAEDIQKDPAAGPNGRSLQTSNHKAQVKQWFESMGIDTNGDGFAHDMYHLMTGIDEKLSPTADFNVSAGNGVHMGVTF